MGKVLNGQGLNGQGPKWARSLMGKVLNGQGP